MPHPKTTGQKRASGNLGIVSMVLTLRKTVRLLEKKQVRSSQVGTSRGVRVIRLKSVLKELDKLDGLQI